MSEMKGLINNEPSADNFSNLPSLFDNLQSLAREKIASASIDLPWYEQYLEALRNIRLRPFPCTWTAGRGSAA
jgi:hypothetical protein